jgi:predicted NAD-dependent protein-ADP-ribosyltransferase YbiA (DUF1768 family)
MGYPIVVNNKDYQTTEHFFQAHKFAQHPHLMDFIRSLPTPEYLIILFSILTF